MIEIGVRAGDGIEPGGKRRAQRGDTFPAFAGFDRLGRLGRGGFRRAVRQRDDLLGRRPRRLARGVRIVRRPLPAGTLAEHAAQAQKDENRQRQEYDGVDVEHVLHALYLYRQIGPRPGR